MHKSRLSRLCHNWGFKKECLIEKWLWRRIYLFIVFNILQLWCIIMFLLLEYWDFIFFNFNNYWMFYKSFFESFTDSWSIVHITYFYKWLQKEWIKWCNWFQIFCTWKPCFPLCNYMFIKSIWWNNISYEILKQKVAREMIPLLNHLASFYIH
jgi:hypothetical protein